MMPALHRCSAQWRTAPASTSAFFQPRTATRLEWISLPRKKRQSRNAAYFFPSGLHFAEGLVEAADAFVNVGAGNIEHGRETQNVAVKAALADEQAIVA